MIYTIGYATKPLKQFIEQLQQHGITAACDLRSAPYSKRFFYNHQHAIKASLHKSGIRYV